jgi:hypothetical protein
LEARSGKELVVCRGCLIDLEGTLGARLEVIMDTAFDRFEGNSGAGVI